MILVIMRIWESYLVQAKRTELRQISEPFSGKWQFALLCFRAMSPPGRTALNFETEICLYCLMFTIFTPTMDIRQCVTPASQG